MKPEQLFEKGVIINPCDYHFLEEREWFVGTRNEVRSTVHSDGRVSCLLLHRVIMQPPVGMEVDHVNGNRLDNTRKNLRVCTHLENMQNMSIRRGKSTKGIRRHHGKWQARITLGTKLVTIGSFRTENEAQIAYNLKAKELFGEFAREVRPSV